MNFKHLSGSSAAPLTLKFAQDPSKFIRVVNKTVVIQSLTNPNDQIILRGHSSNITCTAAMGRYLLTGEGGYDSDAVLWDMESGAELQRICEHDGGIISVDFSEDGLFYCTYGTDGLLNIIELASGDIVSRQYLQLNNAPAKLTKLAFGGRIFDPRGFKLAQYHLIAIGESNQLVKLVFIPKTGQTMAQLISQSAVRKQVTDIAFLSDRNFAVAVTASGEMIIIDIRAGSLLFQMGIPGQVTSLSCVSVLRVSSERQSEQLALKKKIVYQTYQQMSQLDEIVAVGGQGVVVILRGQGSQWQLAGIQQFKGSVIGIDSDYTGRILFETAQGEISVMTQPEYKPISVSQHHTGPVTSLEFLGDKLLCVASKDRTIRIFDLTDYMPGMIINTDPRPNAGYPLCVTLNEIQLVAGFSNGDLRVYDAENGDILLQIAQADPIAITAVSCEKNLILIGGQNGDVRIWDLRGSKIVEQQKPHNLTVSQVCLRRDSQNKLVSLSSSEDRYLVAQCEQKRIFDFQLDGPVRAFVLLDGIVACAGGRAVELIDLKEHKMLTRLELQVKVMSICVRGDSELIAGLEDGSLARIQMNGAKLTMLDVQKGVHGGAVTLLASQDNIVVSADDNGEMIIWE